MWPPIYSEWREAAQTFFRYRHAHIFLYHLRFPLRLVVAAKSLCLGLDVNQSTFKKLERKLFSSKPNLRIKKYVTSSNRNIHPFF